MTQEQRYSQDDLAAIFGRTTRTIYAWRQRGIVPPPHRIFREPYWTEAQVNRIRINVEEVYGSLLKSAEVDTETK
jgi:hypothetical protein